MTDARIERAASERPGHAATAQRAHSIGAHRGGAGSARPGRSVRVAKPVLFVLCALPACWLVYAAATGGLGPNPVETITHFTGEWALRLLLVTLAVTPLRKLTGYGSVMRVRRMLGLYAFFYAFLHVLTYVWLDAFFSVAYILDDVVKRLYITAGFTAFCLLVPLAATSTNAMIRRLGGRRWQRLHRLVYVAAAAAVAHFLWLVKADYREPLVYAALLALLLALRAPPLARRLGRLRSAVAG